MAKYSYEQKLKVVLKVIDENVSCAVAGSLVGVCKGDAQQWVKLYQEHGSKGLLMKKGTYDGHFKANVIEYMHENHLSIRETAAKFGIPSHTTVAAWERIFYEKGREALFEEKRGRIKGCDKTKPRKPRLDPKVEEDLISENQRLKMENAYLKKLQALIHQRVKPRQSKR